MTTRRILFLVVLTGLLSSFGLGQTSDRDLAAAAAGGDYVISVKPGRVSHIEGAVNVLRTDGSSGPLVKGDSVSEGDIVTTAQFGRAEIQMNPGSYVRLDYNSSFTFTSTSLSDLRAEVKQGSAIFEVYASKDFKVKVTAGDASYYLIDTGVYRVDILPDSRALLEVHRGNAQVANLQATSVKKGRMAIVTSGDVTVTKFNRDLDSFEKWSKDRGKTLAKATKKLRNNRLGRRLVNTYRSSLWNCYDSFGLWLYDPAIRSFGFLPFGYGWRTPYGYRLRTTTDICTNPWYYDPFYWDDYYRYRNRRPIKRGSGGNGGGSTGGRVTPQENVERGRRTMTPPFRRIERSGNVARSRSRGRSTFDTGSFPSSTGRRSTGRSSTRSTRSTRSTSTPRRSAPRTPPLSRTRSKGKQIN